MELLNQDINTIRQCIQINFAQYLGIQIHSVILWFTWSILFTGRAEVVRRLPSLIAADSRSLNIIRSCDLSRRVRVYNYAHAQNGVALSMRTAHEHSFIRLCTVLLRGHTHTLMYASVTCGCGASILGHIESVV